MQLVSVNFESQETIFEGFEQLANKLAKDWYLKINNACYRLVDFEFYCFGEAFPDPHTYKNKLQLKSGKLYLHGSGLDITFGDGINHGGILVRSVIKLYEDATGDSGFMKAQFDGPLVVATELFSNLHALDSEEKNEIALIERRENNNDKPFYTPVKIIKTKRVGLTHKPDDLDDFYMNLPLRYIIILPAFPMFKQKVKGIEALLSEEVKSNNISQEDANKILGYNRNFS